MGSCRSQIRPGWVSGDGGPDESDAPSGDDSRVLRLVPLVSRLPALFASLPLPLLALGLALAGQVLVTGRSMPWVGALLLVAGGLLLGVTAWRAPVDVAPRGADDAVAERVDQSRHGLIGGWSGLAAIVTVTLLAAAFRLPLLGQLPPGSRLTRRGSGWTHSTCSARTGLRSPGPAGPSFTS